MNISIIIPNWNGKKLLENNLPGVVSAIDNVKDDEKEIIIVDDGSTDDSVIFLKRQYPKIQLILLKENTGFVNAINSGVKKATGEVVILLNNDVTPEINFINPLLKHFDDQNIFAVGCLEKNLINGKVELSGKAKGWFEKGLVCHSKAVDMEEGESFWVSGGSGAFRKSMWEKLGGMDNLFRPFYWEDIDLSYRVRKMGYKVYFEPKSIVNHNHETTIGGNFTKQEIEEISVKNQILFVWKNVNDTHLLLKHFLWLPIHILKNLLTGNFTFINGVMKALKQLPEILTKKKLPIKLNDKEILTIK